MTRILFATLLVLCAHCLSAQTSNYSLVQQERLEKAILKADTFFHTSMRPYRMEQLHVLDAQLWKDSIAFPTQKKWLQALFNKDLATIKAEGILNLRINPILNLEVGRQASPSKNLYANSRGLMVQGEIGKQVSIESGFVENQAVFADYIEAEVRNNGFSGGTHAISQQGAYKKYGQHGFDFSYAFGNVSYSPSKYFNVQLGHGKQFIGDGYRSLLLSDNSFFYPYLKLTTQIGPFQYTNLFTQFQNLTDMQGRGVLGRGHNKKPGSFHYLSVNIGENLQIGLFEAIVWQATDSSGYQRGFDVNYFNPVIFFRPVEFSLGSPDNALMGFNIRYDLPKIGYLYGQAIIDDIKLGSFFDNKNLGDIGNKLGWQLGIKFVDFVGIEGLHWRNELNIVRPYTYSHRMVEQNYTHFSQALAHPLGANFREVISMATYQKGRWQGMCKIMAAKYGEDQPNSIGGRNPFNTADEKLPYIQETGNKMFQGLETNWRYVECRIKYVLNPVNQLGLELRVSRRSISPSGWEKQQATLFSFALVNLPINRYYDF